MVNLGGHRMAVELVEGYDFHNSWAVALNRIMKHGDIIQASEELPTVWTRDSTVVIELDRKAIQQIEDAEIHPKNPLGSNAISVYADEYTYEYVRKHNALPIEKQFDYLYMDRFINYPMDDRGITHFDQLEMLAQNIRYEGINRRHQMITWIPWKDSIAHNPPCLQRIQMRVLDGPDERGRKKELGIYINLETQFDWRSRDFYGAWQPNMIGLFSMLNRYVCRDEFRIVKHVDISTSGHIYEHDWDVAKDVKMVGSVR